MIEKHFPSYKLNKKEENMAIRIIFLLLGALLVINIVLMGVGALFGVNLYQKYGKQILSFLIGFVLFIVAIYILFAILGLQGV